MTAGHAPRATRQMRGAALLIALPAIVAALAVALLEGSAAAGRRDPQAPLPFTAAVRADALADALAHIRAGQDVNRPVPYRDDQMTGDRTVLVMPLLIAVAHNRENMVMLLMSFGVRLDAPGNAMAVCLANQLGHERLAQVIIRDAGLDPGAIQCPAAAEPSSAPLLAFAAAAP